MASLGKTYPHYVTDAVNCTIYNMHFSGVMSVKLPRLKVKSSPFITIAGMF